MRRSKSNNLAAFCLFAAMITSTSAMPPLTAYSFLDLFPHDSSPASRNALLVRDDSSCADNYTSCGNSNLPSNFCCPSSTTCLTLNNDTSIICCPSGQTCTSIQPITCDLSQQNATLHPEAAIKSTNLTGSLSSCGDSCCPRGYSCSNSICTINKNKLSSDTSSTASVPTSTATGTKTSVPNISSTIPTSSSSPSSSESSTSSSSASSNSYPARAILAGFFPGLALGVLIALLFVIFLGRRRAKKASPHNSKTHPFGRISAAVSDPIYQEGPGNVRTDFLRREESHSSFQMSEVSSNAPGQRKSRIKRSASKVRSYFSPSTYGYGGNQNNANSNPLPPAPPRGIGIAQPTKVASASSVWPPSTPPPHPHTPQIPPQAYSNHHFSGFSSSNSPPSRGNMQREPSSESIKVYSTPERQQQQRYQPETGMLNPPGGLNGGEGNRATTFSGLIESARRGSPAGTPTPPDNRI
ncbi:MAG: hypothetical protein M1834_006768 [Cirrosporium novae-zelandiae]|nr:MAG: hypothetical protein M1834_006768 [Cirrosporium novae-zelandiae]